MNRVFLSGRLTADAELKTATSGKSYSRFSLAVDRFGKDAGADFINCTAFGRTAEIISQYTHKGDKLVAAGRIQTGSYERDGRKAYTFDVVVDEVELPPKRKEEPKQDDGFMPVPDDVDLPF